MQNSKGSYGNLAKLASSFNQVATTLTSHQNVATCSRPRPGLRAAHGRLGRGRPTATPEPKEPFEGFFISYLLGRPSAIDAHSDLAVAPR